MSLPEFSAQTAKNLFSYYPVLVPCLFVFYYESLMSLQSWRSVTLLQRREPEGIHEEKIPENRNKDDPFSLHGFRPLQLPPFILKYVESLAYGILIFVAVETFVIGVHWRFLSKCLLFAPFMSGIMLWKFEMVPFHDFPRCVGLNKIGLPMMILSDMSPMPFTEYVALPALAAIDAIYFEHSVGVLFVCVGILYALTVTTFRIPLFIGNFKAYALIASVMGALGLVVVSFPAFSGRNDFQYQTHADEETDEMVGWVSLIVWNAYLFPTFIILCMLLRFDFINSPVHVQEQDSEIWPDTLIFLTYDLPNFPRPYHTLACGILGGSFIVLAFLSAAFRTTIRVEEVGFFVGSFATPGMVCGAFILAAMKGKLNDLWEYKDDWGPRAKKGVPDVRMA